MKRGSHRADRTPVDRWGGWLSACLSRYPNRDLVIFIGS